MNLKIKKVRSQNYHFDPGICNFEFFNTTNLQNLKKY